MLDIYNVCCTWMSNVLSGWTNTIKGLLATICCRDKLLVVDTKVVDTRVVNTRVVVPRVVDTRDGGR